MNIETVNELIQSLESAGEMSIKEQKYLDVMRWAIRVAGERDATLNAECVWEKTMMEACGEDGPASVANEIRSLRALRDTAIQALKSQVKQLAAENVGMDGFVNEMLTIAWQGCDVDGWTIQDLALKHGLIRQEVYCADEHETLVEDPGNFEDGDDVYFRAETPTTDRIVAGIKADAKSHDLNAFISHYSAELDEHIANGGGQFDERSVRLRGVIVGARMFREKLREEEKALVLREGAK
ncbi:TPA: hypothetical protein LVK80_001265 [Klebsiella michiganensis]|nr:hypothetical protein [Klebsiella michiganensis]